MARRVSLAAAMVLLAAGSAGAHVHPVVGTKLIVVDAPSGRAKVVFVAKDTNVIKGIGTDPAAISAALDVDTGASHGAFVVPPGAGWINGAQVARYVNTRAPSGGAVKATVLKQGRLIKLVAKSLGDQPLDVSLAPDATVFAAYSVVNGDETHRHCTQFTGCSYAPIGGGAGHKLLCKKSSAGDPACRAVPPASTTSTVVSTTSTLETTTTSTSLTATTSTSTTIVPLQITQVVDCCRTESQCIQAPAFSLSFYLMQYCDSYLPGSTGVWGGVCGESGVCDVQPLVPPRRLCCRYPSYPTPNPPACYDSGVPLTTTAQQWMFNNQCVGGSVGVAYEAAVCDSGGACIPE